MKTKMDYYNANENLNYDTSHSLLYTFQYKEATAQVFTTMSGNVTGAATMTTEFDCGFTVPANHELTKKHVVFYDDEDEANDYREVGSIVFYYPNGDTIEIDLESCADYVVGIQIVGYFA